jgi:phenylpyruvate tautomerase PptA (4-oxalocrotonate tautomerase family)
MPLLRVTHQAGAFTDAQKAQLAEAFTHAILIGEQGVDNDASRTVAYVIFDEIDTKTSWFTAGKIEANPPAGGRFIFDVIYPYGAADQTAKNQLIKDINDIVANVLGVDGTFPNRIGDWVLIHEITEGNWGVSGQTVSVRDIHSVMQGAPERAAYFEPLLAAQKRLLEAHHFPAGAPGSGQ